MRFGVTLTFFMLNGGVNLILFIIFRSFILTGLLLILLHVFGYLCCLIDPRIFDLLLGKLECMKSKNRKYWGCNSYDPS